MKYLKLRVFTYKKKKLQTLDSTDTGGTGVMVVVMWIG